MRKFCFSFFLLLSIFVFSISSFARLYHADYFKSMGKSEAQDNFKGFEKLISSALNSGLGDFSAIEFSRLGVGVKYQSLSKKDFLEDASFSSLFMPYLFAGINISSYTFFGRVIFLPYSADDSQSAFLTVGATKEVEVFPLFYFYPSFLVHQSFFMDSVSFTSLSLNCQALMEFLFVSPFISAGVSYNVSHTDFSTLEGELKDDRLFFHASLGVKILNITVETQFLPLFNVNLSYSMGF